MRDDHKDEATNLVFKYGVWLIIAAVSAVFFLRSPGLAAHNAEAHQNPGAIERADVANERALVGAMFFSNFCSACRLLEPRIDAVDEEFAERAIDFIVFNQTLSAVQSEQLNALAERHDVVEVWERHRGSTGFMVLVDAVSGEALEIITIRYSEDDIRNAIDRWLTSAA